MCMYAVADPDLPIKGWGGGGGGPKKLFFPPFWPRFGVKIQGGGGGGGGGGGVAGPCPGSPTDVYMYAVGVCF